MMRFVVRILVLTLIFALASWQFGWLSIPTVGLAIGLTGRVFRIGPLTAGIAAALTWGVFLAYAELAGSNSAIAQLVAGGIGTSPTAVFAAMFLFPALLALSAAMVGSSLVRIVGR